METKFLYDVRPEQYATVIRELIRHENDVTNHRTMWLLVVQGLFVNAYVGVRQETLAATGLEVAGILVTLSAFVMLYKSYHARGYLHFLGIQAKRGELSEQNLGLDGWPKRRIRDWRRSTWKCPWLERAGDLLEPYLSLPTFIVSGWMFFLLRRWVPIHPAFVALLAIIAAILILSLFCIAWVRAQRADENESIPEPMPILARFRVGE